MYQLQPAGAPTSVGTSCAHRQGLRVVRAPGIPFPASTVSRPFDNWVRLFSGSQSGAVPEAGLDCRNTSTTRGRTFPTGSRAELRPRECEAGLGRCTAPGAGEHGGPVGRGRQTSVPRLLPLPSALRSSSLGSPPTLALRSAGSHPCSTLRSPCQASSGLQLGSQR